MELSRSEQKRRIRRLEELAAALAELQPALVEQLPATEAVRALLKETACLRDGAKKRQLKYVVKLLRDEPTDELYEFLAARKGTDLAKKKRQQELEHLRDALIAEAIAVQREAQDDFTEDWQSAAAEEIAAQLGTVDKRELVRLAFLFAGSRNKKYSRELLRMLQAAQAQECIRRKMHNNS